MPPKKKVNNKKAGQKKASEPQIPLDQLVHKLHHTEKPIAGYVPHAVRLVEIPNKGRGYIAAQDLPAGSLIHRSAGIIFSESDPNPPYLETIPADKQTSVKFLHHLTQQFGPSSSLPVKIKSQLIHVFKNELHPRSLEDYSGKQRTESELIAELYCSATNVTSEKLKSDLVRFGLVAVMNSFQVHYNISQHMSEDYGVFPSASFFNHSCHPNGTGFYSQKFDEYWVHTLVDVKAGEEITIPYVDLYHPKRLRQSKLQLQYEFACQCTKCLPVDQGGDKVQNRLDLCLETFLCPVETCKGLLLKSNHPDKVGKLYCELCNHEVEEAPYEELYTETFPRLLREIAIEYQQDNIEAAREKADNAIQLLKSSRIHPYNTYSFQLNALQANVHKKRLNFMLPNTNIPVEERYEACEQVIAILQSLLSTTRMVFPRNHPQIGHVLIDIASIQSIIGKEEAAQESVRKAQTVLKISRGEELATNQIKATFGIQKKKLKVPKHK